MRLVLSGYYGFGNIGDEAILAGMVRTLRAADPDLELTVISGDPPRTEREHGLAAVGRMRPTAIARALRRADGLISGGGGLLQDRTSSRPVAYYAAVMGLARLVGRPYAVHAQGLGPIRRRPNRRIAALALRGAAAVSLRDAASIELARAIGVERPIDLVPDPALALGPTGGSDRSAAARGPIVVAVRTWPTRADYLGPLRAAVEQLAETDEIVALPMQGSADLAASEAVTRGIRNASVLPATVSVAEAVEVIGSASLVVGMRLHALILAAGAGVPAVAISYDPKVDAFADRAGQPIVAHVDRQIDVDALVVAALTARDADPAPGRARVAQLRDDLARSAEATLRALRRGPA